MKIAIMQPYFFPYAGYFRLFASADVFVLYDCVQFPRRGWVHRNRMTNAKGEMEWLTLPLAPAPVSTRILSMCFGENARGRVADQVRRFPLLRDAGALDRALAPGSIADAAPLVDYLEQRLAASAQMLGVSRPIVRSSTYNIPEEVAAQSRILAICEAAGATDYINSPGGVELYDAAEFKRRGIALHILPPWSGAYGSVLEPLATGDVAATAEAIVAQSL